MIRILGATLAAALAWSAAAVAAPAPFDLTSTSFKDGERMALKHAGARKENPNCLGGNVSPQLAWANPPDGTRSYAITLTDPEGRLGLGVIHWVAYGIAASVHGFAEGELSTPSDKYVAGKSYYAGYETIYVGPCPPPNSAPHHYLFTIIATDLAPDALPPGLTMAEMLQRLDGHAKAAASLVGVFSYPGR